MENTKLLVEIGDLCERLGIGKNTAYKLLSDGDIDAFRVGTVWKIPVKSIDEYIERKIKETKTVKANKRLREMCRIVK